MSTPAPLPAYPPRRLRRAPRRSDLRIVCPRPGDVVVGVAVQLPLADVYASLAAVETNPQRRECLEIWSKSLRSAS